jgi:hypothetical protein
LAFIAEKEFAMGKKVLFCFVLLLFLFVGCEDLFHPADSDDNGSKKGGIAGTWEGVIDNRLIRVIITSSSWILSDNSYGEIDRGTYTLNGISAELRSTNYNNIIIGMAVLLDSDTIRITLNSNSFSPGAYTLYRED